MGPILSSNRDYNHVLAIQPRSSVDLAKLEVSDNLQQQPLVGRLSIPDPVRRSQLKPSPPSIKQPIQSEHLTRSSSFVSQSISPMYNPTMNNDSMVIARSVSNSHNRPSLFGSNRTLVERNGKQFVTEFKERMERRYVQVFDENLGRMRVFEVTDYIPCKTIRPVRNHRQVQLQNGMLRTTSIPTVPSTRPPSVNQRREIPTQSNLLDFRDLNNRETLAREFDLYHSGASLPTQNNASSTTPSARPALSTQPSTDSAYTQPKADNTPPPPPPPQTVPSQYTSESYQSQSRPYRSQSPVASDYSSRTTTEHSETDDSEGVDRTIQSSNRPSDGTSRSTNPRSGTNRNNPTVEYGTVGDYTSTPSFDPFAKPVRTRDHYYSKRPGNNYAQPTNNRGIQRSTGSDYTPFPTAHKQTKRNQYSDRRDSSHYDG